MASAPDDTQQLGGGDPLCQDPPGLSAVGQRNCLASGSPASPFPAGNYTPDVNIDTGVLDPGNDITSTMQDMLGWVFSLMVTITHTTLLAVSLAFGFDLFGSDHQQQIPHALQTMEHVFTLPWLPVAFALGAIVGIVRWWGNRQEGRAIGHWALMIVCAAVGLIMITDPQGTVGQLDTFSNQAAMTTLAAFSDKNPGQPASSYADATAGLWTEMVKAPWCAMEFGDTQWCQAPIDSQTEQWRADAIAHLAQADTNDGTGPDPTRLQACQKAVTTGLAAPSGSGCWVLAHEALRLQDAQTNGELWLAFLPNDTARNGKNEPWSLYHHLLQDRPALAAIRGTGGVGNRLGTLVLTGIGLGFFLLLLIYIAANLLLAGLFFIVLLLLAPVMLLLPAFGDRGRAAFARWLGYACGALLAKVIYAIYLGVLIFASSLVAALGVQAGGWLVQWILFAALWGLAFIYRGRILALLTANVHHEHHHGIGAAAAAVGAISLTRAAGQRAVTRPARRVRDEVLDRRDQRHYLQDVHHSSQEHRTVIADRRAHQDHADQRLDQRARGMLDARYQYAQATIARKPQILQQIAAARGSAHQRQPALIAEGSAPQIADQPQRQPQRQASDRAVELDATLASAEAFVHGVRESERVTGQRYTPRQLADARQAVQHELHTPADQRDYAQLAYRLPGGRSTYQQASPQERVELRERIDRQLDEDHAAVGSAERAGDVVQAHRPIVPRRPVPRRPRPYRRHEFQGAREHLPNPPRRRP